MCTIPSSNAMSPASIDSLMSFLHDLKFVLVYMDVVAFDHFNNFVVAARDINYS